MNEKIEIKGRIARSFFNQCTLTVAEKLIGKILVFKDKAGVITETEAYKGFDDPASHAARGKTKRTELMFGPAGFSYVYLIYGMYHCLNIVTEKKDYPAAVLIRGLKMISTHFNKNDTYLKPNKPTDKNIILDGPGKICRHLGITKEHNGIDIITSNHFYIAHPQHSIKLPYTKTPRIGIRLGQDKLWRFVTEDI